MLVSFVSDNRVNFLFWLVIAAIVFMGVLISIKLKRKKMENARIVDRLAIEKIQRFSKYDKTPMEKLNFIDSTAKEYFKETYGTSLDSNYSILIKEFEKRQRDDEIVFCKAMFATYYSHKELSDERAVALGNLLVVLIKIRGEKMESARLLSFVKRIVYGQNAGNGGKELIAKKKSIIAQLRKVEVGIVQNIANKKDRFVKGLYDIRRQNDERVVAVMREKIQKLKNERIEAINIEKGYMRQRAEKTRMYENGNKTLAQKDAKGAGGNEGFEVKNLWKKKNTEENIEIKKGGVAARIIRDERDRLDKAGVFAV